MVAGKSTTYDVSHLYAYPREPIRITNGEGIYAFDADGKKYIDCASGTFNLSLGYRHPEVVRAVIEAADGLIHVPTWFEVEAIDRLVEKIAAAAPPSLRRVHLKVTGGSTANEGALKLAMRRTGGQDIISTFRSHHGQTLALGAISGNAFRREPYPNIPLSKVTVPDAYCHRCFYREHPDSCGFLCVERIDDFLEFASSGSIAAFIIEPILGSGGNIVPPDGYLQRVREFCSQRNIPLIFDEVQTGVGRTGSMFAAQHFGVEPDILTTAKGLGGGSAAAAILMKSEYVCEDASDLAFTYGANLIAATVAYATLSVIHNSDFLENVKTTGAHILERLNSAKATMPCIDDVRGVGLMIGAEIVDSRHRPSPNLANHIAVTGRAFGLMLRTSRFGRGNVIKIRPPLILTLEEADLLCDRLEQTIKEAVYA